MDVSCNLSLRFVAFCFSTIADPLWSCLNLLTVPYSCSKFSMSHKILHIGQLLWENSWCLLVFALEVQAWCLSGLWPYPSCCVWGVRASSATNPVVLGFASHPLQGLKHCTPSWAHTCELWHGKWASDCVPVVLDICREFLSTYSYWGGHFESNMFCPLNSCLAVCWSTEQQCYSACGLCLSGSP